MERRTNGTLEELVAELIERVRARDRGGYEGESRVMCDVEVAGIRCLVIREAAEPARAQVTLTGRERTIAQMVAAGRTNRAVAAELQISPSTVSAHLRRLYAKLGVTSRTAMVARLHGEGLLVPEHVRRKRAPDRIPAESQSPAAAASSRGRAQVARR